MDVLQAISNRRSHRSYKEEQLPEEILSAILKAGLESPSARNYQPWHFSVVQDKALIQEVHDEAAKVMGKDGSPRLRWRDATPCWSKNSCQDASSPWP